jgi:hypothetical protein
MCVPLKPQAADPCHYGLYYISLFTLASARKKLNSNTDDTTALHVEPQFPEELTASSIIAYCLD